jgi:hypothetical protein
VKMEVALTLPEKANGAVPVVVEYTFENYPRPAVGTPPANGAAPRAAPPNTPPAPPPVVHPTWKEQVLARGWGYALLYPTTLQADNGAGLTAGIIGLTNHGQSRKLQDWGTLLAWAWGGSRLIDYLEHDPAASLARRRFGEQLENVAAAGEYHWMGVGYLKYAGTLTPNDMPVDTHELIALCAPRPVFIGGGVTEGDGWADTRGGFMAEAAAGPVYKLLDAKDLGTSNFPPVDTLLGSGDLAFRQQNGGHTPLPNFPYFLDFAARYFTPSRSVQAKASF